MAAVATAMQQPPPMKPPASVLATEPEREVWIVPRKGVPWIIVLSFVEPSDWWRLRRLGTHALAVLSEEEHGISLLSSLLAGWPIDITGVHGGSTGSTLGMATRAMIRAADASALALVCRELKRRGGPNIPWHLKSKELFLYAAAHASSPESMHVILTMAPMALQAISDGRGYTALHEAAFCRKPRNVEALLDAGIPAAFGNKIGETALHIACFVISEDNAAIAELLVSRDPELPQKEDERGRLAIDRFWEAEDKFQKVEKEESSDERRRAARCMLSLLDPNGKSVADSPERAALLETLGISLSEFVPEEVQWQLHLQQEEQQRQQQQQDQRQSQRGRGRRRRR